MNTLQICQTIGYTIPTLHIGKTTFVSYYVLSLDGKSTQRIRTKINHVKDPIKRKRFGQKLVDKTLEKLEQGWSPLQNEDDLSTLKIFPALNLYQTTKERQYEMGEIRKDTYRSIKSSVKIFKDWLTARKLNNIYLASFSKKDASAFMNYVFIKRKVAAKTYNNYLVNTSTIFNWFISESIIKENPFKLIKAKQLKNKSQKVPLSIEERRKLKDYLLDTNPNYYLACLLLYHTGLRRTELTKIKISDIDFRNKVIYIDNSVAKMNRNRYATIPTEVMKYLSQLKINTFPSRNYLIGKNWIPSDTPIAPKKLSDEFAKCRRKLNFHPKTTFYSLRKTGGISRAEQGMSIQAIKDFFGHTSLSSAVTYFENHRSKGNEELKNSTDTF